MNTKILTLMALLSLAALAAGYPTQSDQRNPTEMDALKLINEIAREQVFKQGSEIIVDEQSYPGMYRYFFKKVIPIAMQNNVCFTQVASGRGALAPSLAPAAQECFVTIRDHNVEDFSNNNYYS